MRRLTVNPPPSLKVTSRDNWDGWGPRSRTCTYGRGTSNYPLRTASFPLKIGQACPKEKQKSSSPSDQSSGANSLLVLGECTMVFDEFIPILLMVQKSGSPVDMVNAPFFAGFHRRQVEIAGFLNHQQYHNKTRS